MRPEDGTASGAVGRSAVQGAAQELSRFVEEVYEDN
jgi:hypothetical protein